LLKDPGIAPGIAEIADVAVVGGGAAGLMAAIWAARTAPAKRVLLLESAPKPGAKILISGGGRCNVTNAEVSTRDFAGSSPPAIAKVLRRFDVPETRRFFRDFGVELKEEPRGKLFPVGDRARTVLDALLAALAAAGAVLVSAARVEAIARIPPGGADRAGSFRIAGPFGTVTAPRLVLATGGMSLPETGSDGHGYALARALGHTTTASIFPALVPLLLPRDHFLVALRGVSVEAMLTLRSARGRRLRTDRGPLLFTHFGLSGPAVLDASRYFLSARRADPEVELRVSLWPDKTTSDLDRELQGLRPAQALAHLRRELPERLARALLVAAGAEAGPDLPSAPAEPLRREMRQALARAVTDLALPISGDRGFRFAEVTAGGVPLSEVNLATMESRRSPGLYLCGEILDVDGRIGGFNFQWAWASGYTAGMAAARSLAAPPSTRVRDASGAPRRSS
jgi:predicted Rossmann fold flavoprotein